MKKTMSVSQGDLTIIAFLFALIMAGVFSSGSFLFNVFYSVNLPIRNCTNGFNCTSNNLYSSMPYPKCTNCTCVTEGLFGGNVRGCCVKGAHKQSMDVYSTMIITFGFVILIVGCCCCLIYLIDKRKHRRDYESV